MWNKVKYGILLLLVLLCIPLSVRAAGSKADPKSAEGLVELAVEAYQGQDEKALAEYYAQDNIEGQSIEFEEVLFQSIGAESIRVEETERLFEEEDYVYVGIWIYFDLSNGKSVPYYDYFLVRDAEVKTIVPEEEYPLWIQQMISEREEEWQDTKLFKKYRKVEKAFVRTDREYLDSIYERLLLLLNYGPEEIEMEENLRLSGVIFSLAVAELLILVLWIFYRDKTLQSRADKIQ